MFLILQHFATNCCNSTSFKTLFLTVVNISFFPTSSTFRLLCNLSILKGKRVLVLSIEIQTGNSLEELTCLSYVNYTIIHRILYWALITVNLINQRRGGGGGVTGLTFLAIDKDLSLPMENLLRNSLLLPYLAFKIRFPCTRRKTGTATLRVKMEFMLPAKKRSPVAEFDLNLRRSCEKGIFCYKLFPLNSNKEQNKERLKRLRNMCY